MGVCLVIGFIVVNILCVSVRLNRVFMSSDVLFLVISLVLLKLYFLLGSVYVYIWLVILCSLWVNGICVGVGLILCWLGLVFGFG